MQIVNAPVKTQHKSNLIYKCHMQFLTLAPNFIGVSRPPPPLREPGLPEPLYINGITVSITWVAQMTGLPTRLHLAMHIFWAKKTFSVGISTPRSPRATIIPSDASSISLKLHTPTRPPINQHCKRVTSNNNDDDDNNTTIAATWLESLQGRRTMFAACTRETVARSNRGVWCCVVVMSTTLS